MPTTNLILAAHPLVTGLLPELVLCVGAVFVLAFGMSRSRNAGDPGLMAILTVLLGIFATWWIRRDDASTLQAAATLNADSLVWFARYATLGVGLLLLLVNRHVPRHGEQGEFFALMLFSLAGISLVTVANDLILLFLALELVSVPTYILIGLSRKDIRAQEATGKYFFLGAFAAAIMLYGFSFLYGAAGTTRIFSTGDGLPSITATLGPQLATGHGIALVGLLLTLGGLAFKIAAVPLHFYVADVYQGAASPVTGLLGFVPKFAGFLAIIRILSAGDWMMTDALFWLLWILAAATMFVGNTLALMQQNVKRMLAYSSIAHSGYMLVGLVAGPGSGDPNSPLRNGLTAVLFYMVLYGVTNLGAFAALSYLRKPSFTPPAKGGPGGVLGEREGTSFSKHPPTSPLAGGAFAREDLDEDDSAETLDDLAGAARHHPWAALALSVCVLGLMGLPPTGGFIGKLYIFTSAVSSAEAAPHATWMLVLVVLGVLNSAIAAAYYLRIIANCYLGQPQTALRPSTCLSLRLAMALCVAFVVTLFARPSWLFNRASTAIAGALPDRAASVTQQAEGTIDTTLRAASNGVKRH